MTSREPLHPTRTLMPAPVRQLSTTTTMLLVTTCVVFAFGTWADWNRYQVAGAYVAGEPGVGVADLVGADNTSSSAAVLILIASAATAVVFLMWLWRARRNAELINPAAHRLGRGWTIGGWFCPVVNLWYPRFVVDDIWRASRPDVENDRHTVRGLPHSPLVRYWWYLLVANWLVTLVLRVELSDEASVELLYRVAVLDTISTLLLCGAAALLIQVLRQVTEWQSTPREHRDPA